jgi:hypothetical protein
MSSDPTKWESPLLSLGAGDPLAEYHLKLSNKNPPPVLYHYTSEAGFLAIMGSQCLHGTERTYLNDESEWTWGYDIFKKILNDNLKKRSSIAYDIISQVLNGKESDGKSLFVVSLSERIDIMSQWERYANDLNGYAIGLDAYSLRMRAGFDENLYLDQTGFDSDYCYIYHLLPVIYTLEYQERVCRDFLDAAIAWLDWNKDSDKEHILSLLINHRLPELLISLKNPQWALEAEWRLVRTERKISNKIKFRHGYYGITPYVQFNVTSKPRLPDLQLSITELWVGGNSNYVANPRAVDLLLKTKDIAVNPQISPIKKRRR